VAERNVDRLREWVTATGVEASDADALIDSLREMVRFLALVLEVNAPNYITITYETDGDGDDYELTIRKHGGMTPSQRIAALEGEVERLRARLNEERAARRQEVERG